MDEQTRQALDSYIKESVAQGFSRSEIEQALLAAGWSADMIAEGFGQTPRAAAEPIPVPEVPPKKQLSARFKWLSIATAVLVLASGAVWNFLPDPPLDERPVLSPIRDVASSATATVTPSVSADVTATLPPAIETPSASATPAVPAPAPASNNQSADSSNVINFTKEESYIFQLPDSDQTLSSMLLTPLDSHFTVPYCGMMARNSQTSSPEISKSDIALQDEGVRVWLRCSQMSGNTRSSALLRSLNMSQTPPADLAVAFKTIACVENEQSTNPAFKKIYSDNLSLMIDRQKYDDCVARRDTFEKSQKYRSCQAKADASARKFAALNCVPGDDNTVGGFIQCAEKEKMSAAGISAPDLEAILKNRVSNYDDFYSILFVGCLEGKL